MIVGPALIGMIDRRSFGHRREVVAVARICLTALLLVLMAARRAALSGLVICSALRSCRRNMTGILFVLIGFAVSAQPLLYGMTRQLVDAQNAGKALAAINLAFFLGAALMQSINGRWSRRLRGLPAVLLFMAAVLIVGTIVFLLYT